MRDYTYLFRDELPLGDQWIEEWDLFISAFTRAPRLKSVYDRIKAKQKHWFIHNEYKYDPSVWPAGPLFHTKATNEADYIIEYFENFQNGIDLSLINICIDITGMMRPHLMFLIRYLHARGVKAFDVIYSEPSFYSESEKTQFSFGSVEDVRQINTFEGIKNNDTQNDLLIIGAGYESHLISEVAEDKDKARKIVILGLPSLSADMYQQNALRTRLAADALGDSGAGKYFVPANDPFSTANVLSEIVHRENMRKKITNLYLSPLSTKPQVLGFVLFYIGECSGSSSSIIFPFSTQYTGETSEGISRIWKYTIEFPFYWQ